MQSPQDNQYIPIVSDDVPCTFDIKLVDRTYAMTVRYNEEGDFFTVDLATALPTELLCYGEVIRYGKPLFEQFSDERYPLPLIVPLCGVGDVDAITYDNFGHAVKLWLIDREATS